jgi:TetR/AcrR family transcriptional regulator, ethionamide resistance regulator
MIDTEARPRRAQRAEAPSKGDLRERDLLDAAGRLLRSGEFGDASITAIAQEAGLSRASFYFYFASKQALLASLLDDAVSRFNGQIASVVEGPAVGSPADAVRATVQAAAELWWEHGDVLRASVELGTEIPEVYERTMANFAVVGAPTVELLRRYGTVPEAKDVDEATALVTALMLMSERNYFHLMRGNPTIAERDALTATLQRIWLRSFGLDD